ncbi:MAG: DUF4435 domain-containing protein [Cytophagales bacterium]|nr:MAG: DUF4435 domain-containing protein [Cytophagales bacterium]
MEREDDNIEELRAWELEATEQGYTILCILETERYDKDFWEGAWKKYLPNHEPMFKSCTKKGKKIEGNDYIKQLLSTDNAGLAKMKIRFCIDADYNILTQNPLFVNKNYVLHTEGYAFESLCLLPEALNKLAKEFKADFDFNIFFEEYSKVIFDIFCYVLHFTEISNKANESMFKEIDTSALRNCIGFSNGKSISIANNAKQELDKIRREVKQKIEKIKLEYPEVTINTIEQRLRNDFQISPTQTYMYINSHIVFDDVVNYLFEFFARQAITKAMKDMGKELVKEKELTKEKGQTPPEYTAYRKYYDEKISSLKWLYKETWLCNYSHPLLEKVGENMKKSFENL